MRILGIIASGVMKKITDTFTRTVSGALGTSDTGQLWTTLRGTWFANGSQAQSNDAGSAYALATVPVGSANATVSASVSGGCGVSFWATDSGSWFAVVPYYNQTASNVYNPCCSQSPVCSQSTYTIGAATCTSNTTTTWSYLAGSDFTRPCNSGGDKYSCEGTLYLATCFIKTYSCPSNQYYNSDAGMCYWNPAYGNYPSGATRTCSSTSYTAPVVYNCNAAGSCPAGQTGPVLGDTVGKSIAGCYCGSSTTTYSCSCPGGGSVSCATGCSSANCIGSCSYPNCSNCGGGISYVCNGCTETVYSQYYYLRMYSSVAGNVTQTVSDINVGQAIGSIKVITSGTSVTAQAYSGNLSGTIGSAMTHTTAATRGTSAGIIKSTSDYNQGSTVDNFSAEV